MEWALEDKLKSTLAGCWQRKYPRWLWGKSLLIAAQRNFSAQPFPCCLTWCWWQSLLRDAVWGKEASRWQQLLSLRRAAIHLFHCWGPLTMSLAHEPSLGVKRALGDADEGGSEIQGGCLIRRPFIMNCWERFRSASLAGPQFWNPCWTGQVKEDWLARCSWFRAAQGVR